MNNLKRFTVCMLAGHTWVKIGYRQAPTGKLQQRSCDASDATRRTTRLELSLVVPAARALLVGAGAHAHRHERAYP